MPLSATHPDKPDISTAPGHDNANPYAATAELVPDEANDTVEQPNGSKSLHRNLSGTGTDPTAPHNIGTDNEASS